ncbi:hypothetical protein [Streptomyces rubiginosohelvolus]|uniref:hypothetical protein n=1 Tax=Streptomyces rubiginosohelvolus TaxID=67362 RepID=UPI0035DEAB1D
MRTAVARRRTPAAGPMAAVRGTAARSRRRRALERAPRPASAPAVSPSASPGEPRGGAGDGTAPLVPGWKTVLNPKRGIAFDVPVDWAVKSSGWVTYVAENGDPEETPLVGFAAPAILKEKWCRSDDDGNGTQEDTPLASVGSRAEPDARDTAEAARENARLWVYGSYAQPAKEKVTTGAAKPFTTKSALTGSAATATIDRRRRDGPLRLRRQGDRVRLREPGGGDPLLDVRRCPRRRRRGARADRAEDPRHGPARRRRTLTSRATRTGPGRRGPGPFRSPVHSAHGKQRRAE